MSSGRTFLYLSESGAKQISVFAMSQNSGALTLIQSLDVGGRVMPMAITPDRRFLFAALRNEPYRFVRISIDPRNGTLAFLGTVSAMESTNYLHVKSTGRYLLGCCNPPDGKRKTGLVLLNSIGPEGELKQSFIVRTPLKPHSVLPDPSNRFVFAACCDADVIVRFAFDPTHGQLSSDGLSPVLILPGSGPRHMKFHPSGKSLYVVNEYDASICVYRYDACHGSLVEIQTVSAVSPDFSIADAEAADIHLTPDGRFLYVSVRTTSSLVYFRVDPDNGTLTSAGSADTAREPRGFGIDPSGRFLVAAGDITNRLVSYRIDRDCGGLRESAEYPTGDGPNWIEFVTLP